MPGKGLLRWTLCAAALAAAVSPAAPTELLHPTGEVFRHPPTGAAFPVLREEATGRKFLLGADGTRFDSVEVAVRAAEATLPAHRRVLAPAIWDLAEDGARAGEPVKVVLVLRSQPVHDVARPVRERVRETLAPKFARLRAILGGIADRRGGPEGRRQLGDLLREEDRLLPAADREELAAIRREVKDVVHAMRSEILAAARARATEEQDALAASLGIVLSRRVLILSAVETTVPAGRLEEIALHPAVALVDLSGESPPALDRSVRSVGGKTWWDAGSDGGSGVGIGNFDTGVDDTHPDLAGAVVAKDFVDWGSPDDTTGHGTHLAGIMGSRHGTFRGMAPGATVYNGKSGIYAMSNLAMMEAGDWAADLGCDIFSNSIGSWGNSTGNHYHALFNDAASAEISVSVAAAAANYGFTPDGLAPNSTGFNGFCVANYTAGLDDRSENVFNTSSSHGPCSDGRRKPDIAAPGTLQSCNSDWEGEGLDFVWKGGTSMSAPMVAGALALLYDYGASWTPEGMKALLLATTWNGSPTPAGWDYGWGWGALDVAAAFANRAGVHEGTFTSGGSATVWLQGPALSAGERVALCWNREVAWNGADTPTTYVSLVDLDLEVWGTDGSFVGSSASTVDSVERVTAAAAVPGTILKVTRPGPFPSGQTAVDWALATAGGSAPVAISPPAPAAVDCTLSAGADSVLRGEEMTIEATLSSTGVLGASSPSVTLALPPTFTLVAGANPQAIPPFGGSGGSSTATWVVKGVGKPGGSKTFTAQGTFTSFGAAASSSVGTDDVVLVVVPSGTVAIAEGTPFVAAAETAVRLTVDPGDFPVTEMRVRNAGGEFGPWIEVQAEFPWTLEEGTGPRTVEIQVRDSGGMESVVLSDGTFLDPDPPTAAFLLSGGVDILMPWEDLAADLTLDDGEGSGVADARVRWDPADPWSDWIPLDGGTVLPLARPADEFATAEIQVRDFAGNESAPAADSIRIVPADATDLSWAKSFKGTLLPGDAGGSFRIGLVGNDQFELRVRVKGGKPGIVVDLWGPDRTLFVEGSEGGIEKFGVTYAGEYRAVLRSDGPIPPEGLRLSVKVGLKRHRPDLRMEQTRTPVDGIARQPFQGVAGMTLSGHLYPEALVGSAFLVGPGGERVPLALGTPGRRGVPFGPVVLDFGSGWYAVEIPLDDNTVGFRFLLGQPRRTAIRPPR